MCKFPQKYIWWKCLFGRLSPAAALGHVVWSRLSEAQMSEPSPSLEKISELVELDLFCNPRVCRLQSAFSIHTSAVSLMGTVIHHLWVSYLLRKSDDEHIDNTVEEKVRDWDPVLKKWYWYYFSTWIGTGFLTSRSLQSCVTTTQMYLALRAMVTNIQLIRRQLLLRIIFETWFPNIYWVCVHAQGNVSLWKLYQLNF